jgi:hypothetical protein
VEGRESRRKHETLLFAFDPNSRPEKLSVEVPLGAIFLKTERKANFAIAMSKKVSSL